MSYGDEYMISHRPPADGPRLWELDESVSMRDVTKSPQFYTAFPKMLPETMRTIAQATRDPSGSVTVYRASPRKELNPGDWITLSRAYAAEHAKRDDDLRVYSYRVPAGSVRWAQDDLMEYGYFPEAALRQLNGTEQHMRHDPSQGNWYPASGGSETPFVTRTGRRLLYVYQPSTGRHAYLDLDTDLILSDEDAAYALALNGYGMTREEDERQSEIRTAQLIAEMRAKEKARDEWARARYEQEAREREERYQAELAERRRQGELEWKKRHGLPLDGYSAEPTPTFTVTKPDVRATELGMETDIYAYDTTVEWFKLVCDGGKFMAFWSGGDGPVGKTMRDLREEYADNQFTFYDNTSGAVVYVSLSPAALVALRVWLDGLVERGLVS